MAQSLALHLNRALRKGEITGSHRPPARSLKVLATIDDPELDARYPDHTHFIDAQNPHPRAKCEALVSRFVTAVE